MSKLKFKEYIKKIFNLYNYEEKTKIDEIRYIINKVNEEGFNKSSNTHMDLGGVMVFIHIKCIKKVLKQEQKYLIIM